MDNDTTLIFHFNLCGQRVPVIDGIIQHHNVLFGKCFNSNKDYSEIQMQIDVRLKAWDALHKREINKSRGKEAA